MIRFAEELGHWSVDVYLLASVLLLISILAMAVLRQPVHRLAVVKSLLIGLALLAGLCAVPGWSVLHLMTAKPEIVKEVVQPVTPIAVPAIAPDDLPPVARSPINVPPVAPPASHVEVASRIEFRPWAVVGAIELIGAIGVMMWLAVGWSIARALRRQSHDAPLDVQQLLHQIADAVSFKPNRVPNVLVTRRFDVPVAIGLRRPVIVLPARLLEPHSTNRISQAELSTVLAHELAHIQNRDLQWLALSRGLLALFWSQPLYWLARRRMRLDQESLADAAAAELTSRERYAEQLVGWARNLSDTYSLHLASAVGLWEGASQLRQRVALLLDERITILRQFSRNWQLATLAACTLVAASLSLVTLQPAQSKTRKKAEGAIHSSIPTPAPGMPFEKRTAAPNSIVVRVLDENGQPLRAQLLDLFRIELGNGKPATNMMAAITSNDGTAIIDDVINPDVYPFFQDYPDGKIESRPGLYGQLAVLVKSPGHASWLYPFNEVEVFKHGAKADIRLQKSASLKGRVTNTKGEPVAGATVTTSAVEVPGFQTTTTDADGRYELADVSKIDLGGPPENAASASESDKESVDVLQLNLIVRHPEYAEKLVPYSHIPGTVDARLEPGGTIAGRVVMPSDDWQPINNGMRVCAYPAPSQDTSGTGEARLPAYAGADRSGHFHFGPLRAGRYRLFCEKPGWFNPNVNAGLPDIEVRAQETTAAPDLQLSEGSVAHVQLIDGTSHQAISLSNETRGVATIVPDSATNGRPVDVAINVSKSGQFDIRMPPGKCGLSVSVGELSATANEHAMFDVPAKGSTDVKLEVSKKPSQAGDRGVRDKPVVANAKPDDEEALGAAAPDATKGTGSLTVRFEYAGTPPERKELKEYIWRAKLDNSELGRIDIQSVAGTKVFDESLVVGEDRGIANVVIWVRSPNIPAPPADKLPPIAIELVKGHVSPHVAAFQGPREVVWKNENTTACNFVCSSTNFTFGRLLQPGQQASSTVPVDKYPFDFASNVQPWWKGWVLSLPHPYVAVSDEHGVARIENLPPGNWEFQVWHERAGWIQTTDWQRGRFRKEIKAGENDLGTRRLSPAQFGIQPEASAAQTAEPRRADGLVSAESDTLAAANNNTSAPAFEMVSADGLKLPIPKPNQLSGKVVDAKHQPVADVEISIFRLRQSDSSRKLLTTLKTDKNGDYRVDNLFDLAKEFPGGKFPQQSGLGDDILQVVGRSTKFASQSQITSVSSVAQLGESMPMALQPAVTVRGKITDPDGKPVAGAFVSIGVGPDIQNWSGANSAQTDAAGNYVIQDASPFDLNQPKTFTDPAMDSLDLVEAPPALTVSHLGYATKHAELVMAPGTQNLQLERPAIIEGTVVYGDTGKPASNVLVQERSEIHETPMASVQGRIIPILQTASVRTDANGKYKFETLPPGDYTLWAEENDWLNAGLALHTTSAEINRAPELQLTKGGVVSVRLVDADTGKPIPLEKEMTAMISASPMPIGIGGRAIQQSGISPTSEGRFELRSPPGKMGVTSLYMDDAAARIWLYRGKLVETAVTEGQTTQIDLPVKATSAAEVNRGVNSPYAPENQPPAGPLKNAAPAPAAPPSGAVPVTLPAPPIVPAAPPKPATATLTGHVTGPNGKPIEGASVALTRDSWPANLENTTAPRTTTDSAGNFKLEGLEPFDLNAYYEKVDEQKRRSNDGNILFAAPAILTVASPGLATKPIAPTKIPGNQDVQLEAPAIIEGRVVFERNDREAGNVLVQAVSILNGEPTPSIFPDFHMPVRAEVRTGPDGKYRFTNLRPGSFYVSATAPGWTTNGIPSMNPDKGTTIEKPTQMPDIVFTRGGIVAVRMIDAETNQPIELQPGMRAVLDRSSASNPPTGQNANDKSIAANAQGRFEMQIPPGKWTLLAGWINSPRGEAIWIGHERVPVDIVAGQTIEIDAPLKRIVAARED